MITQEELEALSRKVSDFYGAHIYKVGIGEKFVDGKFWLHDDWSTLMDLAVENGITVAQRPKLGPRWCTCQHENEDGVLEINETYRSHNTDPKQATRVAIMRALIAIKESK